MIGMSCRFPGGVSSPEEYWDFLINERSGIGTLPDGRWADYAVPGITTTGGFLRGIERFDAAFFGLSPREAALMDPQQRMVLELSWEALEHAGLVPGTVAGTDAGVFIGVNADDHGRRLLEDLPRIEAWSGIGSSLCAIANRVSYTLDLRGPSIAVDTACSASLVAIHLACQSLRTRESSVAITGGVMLMVGPGLTAVMDAAGVLSPTGASRPFDATADGYVRSEGAGLLVLKRLSDARHDGDRVLAVIRGSAVTQDGRTDGIMAPSRLAQEHLLRAACGSAGITPSDVDYVEAHGTGTRVGDPIEAGALAEVYGTDRDRPCLVGSVKSNIGHLEAASGVAGVIKTVLALRHGVIPATVNVSTPIPALGDGLTIVTGATPWPRTGRPRIAGTSGYGYGGTIAHVLLEEAPLQPRAQRSAAAKPRLYPLSGASAAAVTAQAARLADWLTGSGAATPLGDVAHTLAVRRAQLPWRATVVATSREELVTRLRAVEPGPAQPGAAPVWVFSGQGSQWPGMGRELAATDLAFRTVLDKLAWPFREECGRTPMDLLSADALDTPDTQMAIFAVQLGLAASWRALGVRPAAVIGHSVGEIAAAVVAGALTEEQGARLVCRRSELLRRIAGAGAMAVVDLPFAAARERLRDDEHVVAAIAAAPGSTVISGDAGAVAELVRRWRPERVVHEVATDIAFHSPHVAPLLDDLARAARDLGPRTPTIPLYSTASADPRTTVARDGDYWAANLGNPVLFHQAVEAAVTDGHRLFLEVSPHPVVTHSITETAPEVTVAYTLRRNKPERATQLAQLGVLHCAGAEVDWRAVHPEGGLADVPGTVWQQEEFRATHSPHGPRPHDPARHDLLGEAVTVHGPSPIRLWRTSLDFATRPYPGRHPVLGTEIVPAAVLLNTFHTASGAGVLTDVTLRTPVPVEENRDLQVVFDGHTLRLSTRVSEDGWLTHTTATARHEEPHVSRREIPQCADRLDPGHVVDRLARAGVAAMGFPWRIRELTREPGRLVATVAVDSRTSALDAALSIAATTAGDPEVLHMPAHIRRVAISGEPGDQVVISVQGDDVEILDPDGTVLAELTGLRYGVLQGEQSASPRRLVHVVHWTTEAPLPLTETIDRVVVVCEQDEPPLPGLGIRCTRVSGPDELNAVKDELTAESVVIVAPGPGRRVGVAAFQASWLLLRVAATMARWDGGPRLWCVTRGVLESEEDIALSHSSLWGVGRVLATEHPDRWGGLVDLPPHDNSGLLDVLRGGAREDIVAVRHGTVLTPSLVPAPAPRERAPLTCRPDGTYLVTGGLGALGREVATWLASRGARRLVLVSRRGLPPRELWDEVADPEDATRIECIRSLESAGVTVRTVAVDITDRVQAPKSLDCAELGLPPIRGVVHAAGVLDSRMAVDVDSPSLIRVMRPKVAGALLLHEMFPPGSLDFFALFSSAGPLLGLPGQASYAAANAFLDALATRRPDMISFGWTSWRGLGMSTSADSIDAELRARGTAAITAQEAFDCWDDRASDTGHVVVLRTIGQLPGMRRPPLLRELEAPEEEQEPAGRQWTDLAAEVTAVISRQLGTERLDVHQPLTELGADSVLVQAIRRDLEHRLAISLPANLFWSAPTAHAIAEHLTTLLEDSA
ncbi:phthiocerol type I polyketide synthase PpsA [Lentzea nigeriaca]